MSKSILIMDTPKRCDECKFHYNTYDENDCHVDKCMILNDETIDGYTEKYDECPLKEVPEKECGADLFDEFDTGWELGWNSCINEILK